MGRGAWGERERQSSGDIGSCSEAETGSRSSLLPCGSRAEVAQPGNLAAGGRFPLRPSLHLPVTVLQARREGLWASHTHARG